MKSQQYLALPHLFFSFVGVWDGAAVVGAMEKLGRGVEDA
jgi:hypothetical protein